MNTTSVTRPNDRLADYFAVVGVSDVLQPLDDTCAVWSDRRPSVDSATTPTPSEAPSESKVQPEPADPSTPTTPTTNGDAPADSASPTSATPDPALLDPRRTLFGGDVLSRFPEEDLADAPFPGGVSLFCFPNGIRLEQLPPPDEPEPKFFSFVATGQAGVHMYGHCLTFWERLTDSQREGVDWTVPRVATDTDTGTGTGTGTGTDTRDVPLDAPFFVPKCFVVLSRWCFLGFREFLTELYRMSLSLSPLPLERIIGNFMMEVPLPPAGRVEVQYVVGSKTLTFSRPPANHRISSMGLQFEEVFQCLSIPNIILVFRCLLSERQILMHSSQLSLLTATAELFCAIMYPFQWPHVYIPLLPRVLMEVLQAPMPFIMGMPTDRYHALDDIPPAVVQIDLDRNIVATHPAFPVPPLPAKQGGKLIKGLMKYANVFNRRPRDWHDTVLPNFDRAFKYAARPADMLLGDDPKEPWAPDWDETRRVFFRFFVALFLQYRRFLVFPSDTNPKPSQRFNRPSFLAVHPSDARPFLEVLLASQAFTNFVDERIQPELPGNQDVIFFDQSIDAKHNRSRFRLTKIETPFLDSAAFTLAKTNVALAPDPTGIEEDATFSYYPFPLLKSEIFLPPRPVPSHADQSSGMGMGHQKLRRSAGMMWAGDLDHDVGSFESSVYSVWFLTFAACLGGVANTGGGPSTPAGHLTSASAPTPTPTGMSPTTPPSVPLSPVDSDDDDDDDADGRGGDVSGGGANAGAGQAPASDGTGSGTGSGSGSGTEPTTSTTSTTSTTTTSAAATTTTTAGDLPTRPPPLQRALSASELDEAHRLYDSHLLNVAFAVLERMQREGTEPDELVYRSLLDASGRCGSVDKAYRVLSEMARANIQPDSSVYSCLVRAFTMDKSATKKLPLGDLEWNKFHSASAKSPVTKRRGLMGLMRLGTPTKPLMQSPAQQARAAMMRTGVMAQTSPRVRSSGPMDGAPPTPVVSGTAASDATSPPLVNKRLGIAAPRSRSSRFSLARMLGRDSEEDAGDKEGASGSAPRHLNTQRSRDDSAVGRSSTAGLSGVVHDDASSVATDATDPDVLAQRPPGFGLLGRHFTNLHIDTGRETCPKCNKPLEDVEIQGGWLRDRNDYTTVCPVCKAYEFVEISKEMGRTGKKLPDKALMAATPTDKTAPRFVARFAVTSSAAFWEGTRGAGEPLYCEYLPPWVLLKEVQTARTNYGDDVFRTPAFRAKCPTVFWNLVWYFECFRLPMDFLLPDIVALHLPSMMMQARLQSPPSANDRKIHSAPPAGLKPPAPPPVRRIAPRPHSSVRRALPLTQPELAGTGVEVAGDAPSPMTPALTPTLTAVVGVGVQPGEDAVVGEAVAETVDETAEAADVVAEPDDAVGGDDVVVDGTAEAADVGEAVAETVNDETADVVVEAEDAVGGDGVVVDETAETADEVAEPDDAVGGDDVADDEPGVGVAVAAAAEAAAAAPVEVEVENAAEDVAVDDAHAEAETAGGAEQAAVEDVDVETTKEAEVAADAVEEEAVEAEPEGAQDDGDSVEPHADAPAAAPPSPRSTDGAEPPVTPPTNLESGGPTAAASPTDALPPAAPKPPPPPTTDQVYDSDESVPE